MIAVIALIFTALLGLAGYVVQSKNAADADRAQHKIVREAADREQTRGLAAIKLERVRSQMAEALVPSQAALARAIIGEAYMARELRFESSELVGFEFVQPFKMWPHLEVFSHNYGDNPKMLAAFKGSPYRKYSPRDIALLEDPVKREVYIDAHTSCMVPCWREVATIFVMKGHLLQRPPPAHLDSIFRGDITSWTKFMGGTLSYMQALMGVFADAWAPLARRWDAGDFSRMQPAPANPQEAVAVVFVHMATTAGANQKELEGATSISGRKNVAINALFGVAPGAEDDT